MGEPAAEPEFDRDGQPVLDSKGRQKQRYPKTTKVVEARGKKAAERLPETWIAELEAHRTIDPDRLKLAELLDRWLEATRGEMRVASYNSYRRIRRIHVDPALGQVLAGKLTRAQLSTYLRAPSIAASSGSIRMSIGVRSLTAGSSGRPRSSRSSC